MYVHYLGFFDPLLCTNYRKVFLNWCDNNIPPRYSENPYINKLKNTLNNSYLYDLHEDLFFKQYLPMLFYQLNISYFTESTTDDIKENAWNGLIHDIISKIKLLQLTSWTALKNCIWVGLEGLESLDHSDSSSAPDPVMFKILARSFLLFYMQTFLCLPNFFEDLVLNKNLYNSFLSEYSDIDDLRYFIISVCIAKNQVLFNTSNVSNEIKDDDIEYVKKKFKHKDPLPNNKIHLGIIMDGNRRWGLHHHLPGHFFGTLKADELLRWFLIIPSIRELTLFCLSIDNLNKRGHDEIDLLQQLLANYLQQLIDTSNSFQLRINIIGEYHLLNTIVQNKIEQIHRLFGNDNNENKNNDMGKDKDTDKDAIDKDKDAIDKDKDATNKDIKVLNLAIAYDPVKESERHFRLPLKNTLNTQMDLVIRCGNVMRTSGFFPLNTLYSEWIFTEILWPDMNFPLFLRFLHEFSGRQRRLGA